MIYVLRAFLGAFSNCFIRGGWWKTLFPNFYATSKWVKYIHGDLINAIIYALLEGITHHNWLFGLCMGSAMLIGAMFAIFSKSTEAEEAANHKLKWSLGVTFRSLQWCLPITFVAYLFHDPNAWLHMIPVAFMPICYSFVWWYKGTGKINSWTLSENTFGIALWLPE